MNLINFINEFPDEESCILHFKGVREKQGVVCKKCGCAKHYWLKAKHQWQCSQCEFRTGIKNGTMMQYAKLPVRTWYLAMAFMSFSKKGISARELQRQLSHNRYESVWTMMHKIREAMGKRDDLYELAGMLEFDEAYFETETSAKKRKQLKRGRGSQRQVNVAVMAESVPLEDVDTGKTTKQCRYFKMKVLETHYSDEINKVIQNNLSEKSIVFTDKSTSYVDIGKFVEIHITEKSTRETTSKTLPWAHIAISNAKRNLLGIYHKIKGKYLQLYLDEFCYKLNRRYFGDRLFDRLTIAVAGNYW
jgi:hypothetical protein